MAISKPSDPLVLFGSLGIMYMADPNQFSGEVKALLKGNNEPFVLQQSYAFDDECCGLGVAEMAWSLRLGRKNRANKEMAYHALDVLHSIVRSSKSKSSQVVELTFEVNPPIPRGYSGQAILVLSRKEGSPCKAGQGSSASAVNALALP
jgi:hypothetical protein